MKKKRVEMRGGGQGQKGEGKGKSRWEIQARNRCEARNGVK